MTAPSVQFRAEYARQRAAEGRGLRGDALRSLPYLGDGPLARQWKVRARSFEAFVRHVLQSSMKEGKRKFLDLGAGNGWLCYRVGKMGFEGVAVDIRDDAVDGLGAARALSEGDARPFACVAASFDRLPFRDANFDITLFNASLHYALDLTNVLKEAERVTSRGGVIAILDSPFYGSDEAGKAMVSEKHAHAAEQFGERAGVLLGQDFIEYLTRERLATATPKLRWTRHRVFYPLWYEMRPLVAWLKGKRPPSRFDLWVAAVP
jgi:ubiquinone/menaquinone biosynthesis C-methylase UbiE